MRARPLLVETRAAERERGKVSDARQEPLVAFGERPVGTPQQQHAMRTLPRTHGHADPVRKSDALLNGRDGTPLALGAVVVSPKRAPGLEHDTGQTCAGGSIALGRPC